MCKVVNAASNTQGPGDNTSADTPYIQYYGRTYNQELIAGIVNVNQGTLPITLLFVLVQLQRLCIRGSLRRSGRSHAENVDVKHLSAS